MGKNVARAWLWPLPCLLQLHCRTGEGDSEPLPALAEPRARDLKQPRCEAGAECPRLMLREFDSLAPGPALARPESRMGFSPGRLTQWSSTGGDCAPNEHLSVSGDIPGELCYWPLGRGQ